MPRVLYNACYGGYHLSDEAWDLFERYCKEEKVKHKFKYGVPRHHPILLRVFDELGSKDMSAEHSRIECEEIEGDKYVIEEYDGLETVVTKDRRWIYIKNLPSQEK
jgi:hypothetical protein